MGHLLFIFIDGLGIGSQNATANPLTAFRPRVLRLYRNALGPFPRAGCCLITDAQLAVSGLPQSATGQTALMTGINTAKRLGRHHHGYPNQALKDLLYERSIFQSLEGKGLNCAFANAYTKNPRRRRNPSSVTTVMCQSAGVRLRTLEDLLAGRSLYMDFTNRLLHRNYPEVPLRDSFQAANVLLNLTKDYSLCLYEYFLTDLVGHRGSFQQAASLLRGLDDFLFQVVEQADLSRISVLVTSDHGNIEKMDRKQHTFNPVPTLLWGSIQKLVNEDADFSLMSVTPLIERFLSGRD